MCVRLHMSGQEQICCLNYSGAPDTLQLNHNVFILYTDIQCALKQNVSTSYIQVHRTYCFDYEPFI